MSADPTTAFVEAHAGPFREVSPRLEGTESAALAIARVKYSHDAMIDLVIADPAISQNKIAKHFGYTPAWVSRIFNSDAFQQRLAVRKSNLVDPTLALSIEERLKALASRSADILLEKLELTQSPDIAMKALELTTKALGYGARQANVAIQQNFIVPMPTKNADSGSWIAAHSPDLVRIAGDVSDAKEI